MITDLHTWLLDHNETIIRFLVYKRIFTPKEIEAKYIDQDEYTSTSYDYGIIKQAIELPDKDVLLGIQTLCEPYDIPEEINLTYYKLSELRIYQFERDNEKEKEED